MNTPDDPFKGSESATSAIKVLSDLTQGHRRYIAVLLVIMLFAAALQAMGISLIMPALAIVLGEAGSLPENFGWMTRAIEAIPAEQRLIWVLCVLALAYILKTGFILLVQAMSAYISMQLNQQWTLQILNTYVRSPYRIIAKQKQGIMVHNTVSEPHLAAKAMIRLCSVMIRLITATVIFITLLLVDWKVTAVLIIIGALLYILTRKASYTYSIKVGQKRLLLQQSITALASQWLNAIKEIKALGVEGYFNPAIRDYLSKYKVMHTKYATLSIVPESLLEFVVVLLLSLVLVGLHLYSTGDIKDWIPILGFFVLASHQLLQHILSALTLRMKFVAQLPSLRLVHDLLMSGAPKEELKKGEELKGEVGDLVFEQVSFAYREGMPVLDGISFKIPKRKMTAFVGPSGSGKSTIAALIMRLQEPDSGVITAKGRNIRDYSLRSWRPIIGFVDQAPQLFNLSIKENIRMGRLEADDEQVIAAAKRAHIHEFIETLPDGYDTMVGDKGNQLSGGQLQRVAIARALVGEPEVLLFDEATSALDNETEAAIKRSIDELAGNKTIIIIAHRLTTIENADLVHDLAKMAHNRAGHSAS
jgi:ABC-type multidrug transport system fused ATPase/permease subunit